MGIKVGDLYADLTFLVNDSKLIDVQKKIDNVNKSVEAVKRLEKSASSPQALVSTIDLKKALGSQLDTIKSIDVAYKGLNEKLVKNGQSSKNIKDNQEAYLKVLHELSKVKHPLDVQKGLFGGGSSGLAKATKAMFGDSATVAGKEYGKIFHNELLKSIAAQKNISTEQLLNVSKVSGTSVKGSNVLRGDTNLTKQQLAAFRSISAILDKELKLAKGSGQDIEKTIQLTLAASEKHFITYTAGMTDRLEKANRVLTRHKDLFSTFNSAPKAAIATGTASVVKDTAKEKISASEKMLKKYLAQLDKVDLAMAEFGKSDKHVIKVHAALNQVYTITGSVAGVTRSVNTLTYAYGKNLATSISPLTGMVTIAKEGVKTLTDAERINVKAERTAAKLAEQQAKFNTILGTTQRNMVAFGRSSDEIKLVEKTLRDTYTITNSLARVSKNVRVLDFALNNGHSVYINKLNQTYHLTDALKKKNGELSTSITNVGNKTKKAKTNFMGFTDSLRRFGSTASLVMTPISNINSNLFNFTNVLATGNKWQNLFTLGFTGIVKGAIGAAKAISEVTLKFETHMRILDISIGKAGGAKEYFNFATQSAFRYGLELESVLKPLAKLKLATQHFYGANDKGFKEFFTDLTALSGNLGHSSEQFGRVTKAYEQFFSKGTIGMEELRQQLGDVIPFAVVAALNVYTRQNKKVFDKLRKLQPGFNDQSIRKNFMADMRGGRLQADTYAPAIAKESLLISGISDTKKKIESLRASYANLRTAKDLFWKDVGDVTGIDKKLQAGTNAITEWIKSLSSWFKSNKKLVGETLHSIGILASALSKAAMFIGRGIYKAFDFVTDEITGSIVGLVTLADIAVSSLATSAHAGTITKATDLNKATEKLNNKVVSLAVAENKFNEGLGVYLSTIAKHGIVSKEGNGLEGVKKWSSDLDTHIKIVEDKVKVLSDNRVKYLAAISALPENTTDEKRSAIKAAMLVKSNEIKILKGLIVKYKSVNTDLATERNKIFKSKSEMQATMSKFSPEVVSLEGTITSNINETAKLRGEYTALQEITAKVTKTMLKYRIETAKTITDDKVRLSVLARMKSSLMDLATTKYKVKFDKTITGSDDRFNAYTESDAAGKLYDKLVKVKAIKADLLNQASAAYPNKDMTGVVDQYVAQQEFIANSAKRLADSKKNIAEFHKVVDAMSEPLNNLNSEMLDLMLNGKLTMTSLAETFKNSFRSIAKEISMMIIKLHVVKPLMEGLAGAMGYRSDGTASTAPTGSSITGMFSSLLTSFTPSFGKVANSNVPKTPLNNQSLIPNLGTANVNALIPKEISSKGDSFNKVSSTESNVNVVVNITMSGNNGNTGNGSNNEVATLRKQLPDIIVSAVIDAKNKRRL